MTDSAKKTKKTRFFGIGKVLPYLSAYRTRFVLILMVSAVAGLIEILFPQFRRYALDNFVTAGTLRGLPAFIAVYLLMILLTGVLNYRSGLTAAITEVEVDRDLRTALFTKLQTLSFSYYSQNGVGAILSRLMSDTEKIGALVSWTLIDSVWHVTYLVGSAAAMLIMNLKLALLVLAILPLMAVIFAFFQRKMVKVKRDIREQNAKITGTFNEGITGAGTVKALAVEKAVCSNFLTQTKDMFTKSVHSSRLGGAFSAAMHFASSAALAIILWKGGVIAREQVGMFAAFMSYAQGMMEPVRWLVGAISNLIDVQVNIERFSDLMTMESDVTDSPEVIEKYGDFINPKKENWEPVSGHITFSDVTFHYPDGEVNVLEHFSLDIPAGSHLAIVGETGAGKSTLVNLACRFYEPTSGRVLIDGVDARKRSQLWLHTAIGYVLQTPHLFSGSVRDNLLMAKPDATEEEIEAALKLVSANEVVERLKDGLDTNVGEGGDLLSTGEKQLICFARAVLAQPKIMILDEATASVDTITEKKIQLAMRRITEGRTTITIAHRLSTVRDADCILVVRDGKIAERGKHRELMKAKGYYYDLYTRQYADESVEKIMA